MVAWLRVALLGLLALTANAGDVLTSNGYQLCQDGGDLEISTLEASFDRSTRIITFDIAGVSTKSQKVSAVLTVSAYGAQVYQNEFNPCDYNIAQLCPIPATSFAAQGNQTIPEAYANQIPEIAYTIPDLDGVIKLQILSTSTNASVGCIEASVTNGKTVELPSVQYVGVGLAAAALLTSGLAAVLTGAHPGTAGSSPSFGEIVGWFQAMAMNGMMSVDYPPVYRSFASNFGFSTGLVGWPALQRTIDNLRASTGGNTTDNSYDYLQNTKLVYGYDSSSQSSMTKRDSTSFSLSDNSSSSSSSSSTTNSQLVYGIQAYSEQLSVPQSNTFMTLLLIFALVVAGLIVLILLFKGILELWTLLHPLPKSFESWRRRYWWRLTKAITGLIIIFYGIWVMYCVYQFTIGGSWAATLLAALSLGLFTALLAGFIIRIVYKARQLKKMHGDVSKLYEDKETWIKYSLFYDSFKRTYWWIFIPLIIGAAARGAIIAGANGHGLVQTIGHLAVDGLLLALLLWTRPYQNRSGNIINIVIQVVRVLSVGCILIFVEELGVSQTAKTIAGFALIITQAVLTGLLAILLAVNAIISCIRENPEKRRRRQAEKLSREHDDFAPLGAHESLLMRDRGGPKTQVPLVSTSFFGNQRGGYGPVPTGDTGSGQHSRYPSDGSYHSRSHSQDQLLPNAAVMGREDGRRPHHAHRSSDLSLYEPITTQR